MMYSRITSGRHSLRPLGLLVLVVSLGSLEAVALTAGQSSRSSSRNTQGYLGVDIHDIREDQLSSLKLSNTHGAIIVGMDHDGPGCKSGLLMRDVILQMDGQAIEGEQQLRRMLREAPPGKQVTFLVSRDGQQRTITAQMANRDEVARKAWENRYVVPDPWPEANGGTASAPAPAPVPKRGNSFFHGSPSASGTVKETHSFLGLNLIIGSAYTGARLEVLGPQLAEFFGTQGTSGLLVREVDPGSPAADAGFKAGDVVVKVNSQQIANGGDWTKIMHENRGKPVEVFIVREKKEQTLRLTPDSKKRSSVDAPIDIEDFFGDSDQAEQTRATLAELAPVFDAMAAAMHQQLQSVNATPEMTHLKARLEMWSANRDLRHQIETAQKQVHAAAEAANQRVHSPEFQQEMDRLRMQMRDALRLD